MSNLQQRYSVEHRTGRELGEAATEDETGVIEALLEKVSTTEDIEAKLAYCLGFLEKYTELNYGGSLKAPWDEAYEEGREKGQEEGYDEGKEDARNEPIKCCSCDTVFTHCPLCGSKA